MNRNMTSTAKSRAQKTPEIKPSDVYELKLQTQKIIHRTRQLRTHLSRVQDRINAHTNAINKTFEQQSDQPQVTTNHSNTIPQLQRSVESAFNTLQTLKSEIERTRFDDKTFSVRELQEEVKIAYCENQRLAMLLQDTKIEANNVERFRSEVESKCMNQNIGELKNVIKELRDANVSLREKSSAYGIKKGKLDIELEIKKKFDEKVPQPKSINDIKQRIAQTEAENKELMGQLETDKSKHMQDVGELKQIIDGMRTKITNKLSGKPGDNKPEANVQNTEENTKKEQETMK